jgi:hypothetical protein
MLLEEAEKLRALLPMLLPSDEKEQRLRPLLQRLPEAKEASQSYIYSRRQEDRFISKNLLYYVE